MKLLGFTFNNFHMYRTAVANYSHHVVSYIPSYLFIL